MKLHEASWLRKSAATAFECALERYEHWNRLALTDDCAIRRLRWRELANVSWKELESARLFFVAIDGLSNDWHRDPCERRRAGPLTRWSLWRNFTCFWPVEFSEDVEKHPALAQALLRPMSACQQVTCTRCLLPAYVLCREQDLGATYPYDSMIEQSKHVLCTRCRTVTRGGTSDEK